MRRRLSQVRVALVRGRISMWPTAWSASFVLSFGLALVAVSQAPSEFEVVSIKPTSGDGPGGGIRRLPDGTTIVTNQPIASIIGTVAPEAMTLDQIIGMPGWMTRERYDVIVKPPAGSSVEERRRMWQAMFADRMKLVAHVEQRERTTFSLVVDRSDGRLGPDLTLSPLDCSARPPDASPVAQSAPTDVRQRCGAAQSATSIVSGGIAMDALARSLSGRAGGVVTNRTGLQGFYALTLNFSTAAPSTTAADSTSGNDAPALFTAIKEQLGLKLVPEKGAVPVMVIEHIERPSPN